MEVLGYISALPLGAEESGGSFLVSPGLGLMIWTLVLFLFTMWVLSKVAFPKIQEALDKRANLELHGAQHRVEEAGGAPADQTRDDDHPQRDAEREQDEQNRGEEP